MNDKEIVEKILNGTWWPFDRVEPHILKEAMKQEKQEQFDSYEEAPI